MTGLRDADVSVKVTDTARRGAVIDELTATRGRFPIGVADIRGVTTPTYLGDPHTLPDVLARAGQWQHRPALTYEDEQWSWQHLVDTTERFASVLINTFGVRRGDRVAIAMRNYPEWVSAFYAAVGVGAIAVPLNSWWSGDELVHALRDCEARLLVADPERAASISERRGQLPSLENITEVRATSTVSGDARWEDLVAGQSGRLDLSAMAVDPDDDATILYTSGTTGRPNGAVASHRAHVTTLLNLQVHAAVESRLLSERGEQAPPAPAQPTSLIPGPLFHVSYLPRVIAAPMNGTHFVLMRKWDAARALDLIERESVDSFTGVPTVVRQLLDEIERRGDRPHSLRSVISGGAQATPSLLARITSVLGPHVRSGTGYGMTETCGAMIMIGAHDFMLRPLSVGRPLPTSSVRVVDPLGQDVPDGDVGEAWFRSASVARGYWNKDSDNFTPEGWLRSGDLVRRDEDGFIYIVDRIKDIVIRGGENVYCAEVEEALVDHPDVIDVAVFGLPHPVWGEEVTAVVHADPEHDLTVDALRSHAAARLAAYKAPSRIILTSEALPRNAAGKVLKRDLRGRYGGAGPDNATAPFPTP